MKTLYILRHAKSSWNDPDLADFDRPLNERGRNAAPFMGRLAAERDLLPDAIVSSPAKRASETAALFREAAGINAPVVFDERIYEASANSLRQVVSEFVDEPASVMLVGHNPGIEDFIRFLTGSSEKMSTAALAVIDLESDSWSSIAASSGTLRSVIRPKDEHRSEGTSG